MGHGGRSTLWLLALLAFASSLPALAVDHGRLRLLNLPKRQTVFVYLDGRPVTPQDGVVSLAPGWRELQVEDPQYGRVFRRMAEMQPNGFRSLAVELRSVILLGPMKFPQAPSGHPGPPGPAGRPASPTTVEVEPKVLAGLLQEALYTLIDDLEGRKEHLHETLKHRAGTPTPEQYYYAPANTQTRPGGVPGPLGPQGPPGVPGDVFVLQTETGQLLLDELKRELNLRPVEERLAAAESRAARLPTTRRVTLFTPELRARFDQEVERQKREYEKLPPEERRDFGLAAPPGAPGPRGRRGPDGRVPADAKPIRLTAQQVEKLLTLITQDRYLQQHIQKLRAEVGDIALWTTEAEQQAAQGLMR